MKKSMRISFLAKININGERGERMRVYKEITDLSHILISIIVPIHNVDNFLDNCIQSLFEQTHENIEVILIDDGSVDKSKEICTKWITRDRRISYYYQYNQGSGPARNKGIKLAKGDYITFIDSDDWVDKNYLETLLNVMIKCEADIVRGSLQMVDNKTQKYIGVISAQYNDTMNVLHYITPHIAANLYKKELFETNQIYMPACCYEDLATYPILALTANKISYVEIPLYFYRRNTGKSIMDSVENQSDYHKAFFYMINLAKEKGIFEKYKELFLQIIIWHMRVALKKSRRIEKQNNYNYLRYNFFEFLDKYFDGWRRIYQKKIICFGSYNLSQVSSIHSLEYDLLDEAGRYFFGYSSIISIMNNECNQLEILHSNLFRQNMIRKELNKEFLKFRELNSHVILIDFLEERYDMLKIQENVYLTRSVALLETDFNVKQYEVLERTEAECTNIWKKACLKFIDFLKTNYIHKEIYLLKLYLTQDKKQEKKIADINCVLQEYYRFFEENFKEAKAIELPACLLYTDWSEIFADDSWYLNKEAFVYLANLL